MKPASTSIRLGLIAACCLGQPCLGWAPIPKEAPEGLLKSAVGKQPAVFTLSKAGAESTRRNTDFGFFISGDGLALCSLSYLCQKEKLKFQTAGRAVLEIPAVLAMFPRRKLALVKFTHKPETWLEIAQDAQPVGTWVAFVGPSWAPEPLLGPILARRASEDDALFLKSAGDPVESYSIAVGRSPAKEVLFTTCAPVLNAEGKVVAAFSGSNFEAVQTLRYAYPLEDCSEQITEAVQKDKRLPVPIPAEHQPYHPWFAHQDHHLISVALVAGDRARAREHARKLVAAFPDFLGPRVLECVVAEMDTVSGTVAPEDYLEVVRRSKPAANSRPVTMSTYHMRLGNALCRAGFTEEGVEALRRSAALDPNEMAAVNLGVYHRNRGELKEAEHWFRQAAEIAPERIDLLNHLSRILEEAGKWEEADDLTDRIYALEHLYSIP